jgi:protein O-mannosyl-transferase
MPVAGRNDPRLAALATTLLEGRGGPVAVALLAFATFIGTLWNGFVFDDGFQILANPWIWSLSGLPNLLTRPVWAFMDERATNFYRPVMSLLHFAAAQIFGRQPFGFHLVLLLTHAGAAAAALLLLRRITGRAEALFAAALFAVHPIHAESVAWISASPDVNATLLILVTLILWDRARRSDRPLRAALPTAATCLLALLSKEMAVIVPVLAVLLPHTPVDDSPTEDRRHRAQSAPMIGFAWAVAFVLPSLIYLFARLHAVGGVRPILARPDLAGTAGVPTSAALVVRYLALAFMPISPAPDRRVDPVASLGDPRALAGVALLVAAAGVYLLLRRRAPAAAYGVVILCVPLLPALQVAYLSGSLQADRYLYLPALGACLLVSEGAGALLRRVAGGVVARGADGDAVVRGRRMRWVVAAVACLLVAVLAVRASWAAAMWRDSETLGRAGIALEPKSVLMRLELIHALDVTNRRDEALRVAEEAEAIAPGEPRVQAALAGLRARAARETGGDPIAIYKTALASDPSQTHLWVGLSEAYLRAGRPAEAIEAAEHALSIERFNAVALANLSTARGESGDVAGEEREARRLLEIDPLSAPGYLNLGVARLKQDDLEGAADALARAATLDPSLARVHLYLSWVAMRRRLPDEARKEGEQAVALDPRDPEAWNHLGAVRAQSGDAEGARAAWERTLAIRPGDPQARANLDRLSGAGPPAQR